MRILVVEDEPKMAELIRKGLEREHYYVLTTGSGPDGLALIRTTAELAIADSSQKISSEALSSILEESERTTNLLEDLLVLARSNSDVRLRLEHVELSVPVRQAVFQAEVLAKSKRVALAFLPHDSGYTISGNADLLRRLFLILADNALKYTPPGGQVQVRMFRHEERVNFEITDTGVGIGPEDLPHIFEHFYRADKARQRSGGAGLGLSIAEWIVKVHHGTMEVSSVVDQGTTFTLRFPSPRQPSTTQGPFDSERTTHNLASSGP